MIYVIQRDVIDVTKVITYIVSFPNREIMMSTYLDLSYTMQSIYQIDYNKPALSILLNF